MLPSILSVPALVSPPVSARQLAAELSQFGLTVLKEPQLDKAQLEQVRQRCSARLSALLDEVQVQGGDPIEQHYTFSEIAHRQRLRWAIGWDQVRIGLGALILTLTLTLTLTRP